MWVQFLTSNVFSSLCFEKTKYFEGEKRDHKKFNNLIKLALNLFLVFC